MQRTSKSAISTATRSASLTQGEPFEFNKSTALWVYKTILLARIIDDKTITLYKQNKCHFQISCAGHEGIQVAAAHVFRAKQDWFYPYYRDMALMVGLGMTAEQLMLNAMNKVADPNSHGRMMPMHYGDIELRVPPQSSPTGSQFLQAVGCALGAKMKHLDEVVYVSAGEGTCAQGDFHEALNWSAREKLPIIFVIENNNYAISVPISEQLAGDSVATMFAGYENLATCQVNGSDVEASIAALKAAHARALDGAGPTLIEAHVPRLQSHSISDNHLKYRTAEDLAKEQLRCPLRLMSALLIDRKFATQAEIEKLHGELKNLVDQAAESAEKTADPDPKDAEKYTLSNPTPGRASKNARQLEMMSLSLMP